MKSLHLLISHFILGVAGWGIGIYIKPAPPAVLPVTKRQMDRSGRSQADGSELISRIRTNLIREAGKPTKEIPEEQLLREKLHAALPGAVLPNHPEIAIPGQINSAESESEQIVAVALFILWLQSDPEAAMVFAFSSDAFPSYSLRNAALELACEKVAPEILLPLLLEASQASDPAFSGIARQSIATKSPEEIALLIQGCAEETRSSLRYNIASKWPADRLGDFGRLATLLDDPELFRHLPDKMTDREKTDWLLRYLDQHPDQSFARRVRSEDTLFFLLKNDLNLPLEVRLDGVIYRPIHQSMSPEAARKGAMEYLAWQDVPAFLYSREEPDALYAFRHGRIEAGEMLKELEARFPEYAEAGLLAGNLHKVLCATDPVRADVLLVGLPPGDHAKAITDAISESSYRLRLDTLSEALQLVPFSEEKEISSAHLRIWKSATDTMLDRYGSDYGTWISKYPDPDDRKLARQAIRERIEGSGNSKAMEIRQIIGDGFLEKSN